MRGALLAVPVLALAACGGSSGSGDFEQAAEKSGEGTSRFELTYRSEIGSSRAEMSGLFDYAGERGVISEFDFEPRDESLPEEVRFIDGTVYVGSTVDGVMRWTKEEEDESGGDPLELFLPLPGGANDPGDVFPLVVRTSAKIENQGSEEVRGDDATHYRAELDPEKLLAELPAEKRAEYAPNASDLDPLPVDVWIDGENRVRRVTIRDAFEDSPVTTTTFDFFDFGVEVDVEAPPADQLVSPERLHELKGSGLMTDEELEALCRAGPPEDLAEACDETEAKE